MSKAKAKAPARKASPPPKASAEREPGPAIWQLDLRNLSPGSLLGGRFGRLQRCSVCGSPGARLSAYRGRRRFAHLLIFRLSRKHEPTVEAELRCLEARPA